jgi:hypothetical protein
VGIWGATGKGCQQGLPERELLVGTPRTWTSAICISVAWRSQVPSTGTISQVHPPTHCASPSPMLS